MKVLTAFAHHGSPSFCHAVLGRFDAGRRHYLERAYQLGREL